MNHENDNPQNTKQLEGQYANYFKVGQNSLEFVIDFGQFYSENDKAYFHTRIISSPFYVNALLMLLQESVNQYEQTFGPIQEKDK